MAISDNKIPLNYLWLNQELISSLITITLSTILTFGHPILLDTVVRQQ